VKKIQISRGQLGSTSSAQKKIAASWINGAIAAQMSEVNAALLVQSGGQS